MSASVPMISPGFLERTLYLLYLRSEETETSFSIRNAGSREMIGSLIYFDFLSKIISDLDQLVFVLAILRLFVFALFGETNFLQSSSLALVASSSLALDCFLFSKLSGCVFVFGSGYACVTGCSMSSFYALCKCLLVCSSSDCAFSSAESVALVFVSINNLSSFTVLN